MKPRNVVIRMLLSVLIILAISTGVQAQKIKEVNATDILKQIENGNEVYLENVIITGELNLSASKLKTVPRVMNSQLLGIRIWSYKEQFFDDKLKIVDSKITIKDSVFKNDVDFSNTQFIKNLDFQSTTFLGKTDFSFASFSGDADFTGASFDSFAIFTGASFNSFAVFMGSHFNGSSDIQSVDLPFKVTGVGGTADAIITAATPGVDLPFKVIEVGRGMVKSQSVDFSYVSFGGDANFLTTSFSGNAAFMNANFNGQAIFAHATFKGFAFFKDAIFDKYASFRGTSFNSWADFEDASFSSDANFINANLGDTDFGKASFNNVLFANAKFTNVNFKDANFKIMRVSWESLKNALFFDGSTYMKLIKNFRDMEQFDDADDAYYQYRLLSQANKNGLSWLIDELWKITCGYGVKPFNTVPFSILIILVFSVIYGWGGKVSAVDALYFSMVTFASAQSKDWFPEDRYRRIAHIIERLFGWFILSLFIVTLTRVMIRP